MQNFEKNIVYNKSMYDNIENNTVKQLRPLAKSQGLKGCYKLNKSNLIDLIKNVLLHLNKIWIFLRNKGWLTQSS